MYDEFIMSKLCSHAKIEHKKLIRISLSKEIKILDKSRVEELIKILFEIEKFFNLYGKLLPWKQFGWLQTYRITYMSYQT